MQVTNTVWLDPKEVTEMVVDQGSDNMTRGMTIYMRNGNKHYISHSYQQSVYDVQRRIVDYMSFPPDEKSKAD